MGHPYIESATALSDNYEPYGSYYLCYTIQSFNTPAVFHAHFYLHDYVIILLKMVVERCPCLADAVGVMLIATIIWIVCSSFEGSFLSFIASFRCQD